ncbi:hypothetical protein Tco_0291330 [Tanacetum coccineum]
MKRTREGSSVVPQKKRARKANETADSESRDTISVTLIRQANLKGVAGTAVAGSQRTSVEKEVVDLSENTHVPTPLLVNTIHQTEQVEHGNTQDNMVFSDAFSFHSGHDEDNDEDVVAHLFVPN